MPAKRKPQDAVFRVQPARLPDFTAAAIHMSDTQAKWSLRLSGVHRLDLAGCDRRGEPLVVALDEV
jgi:hypothetical protein